MEDDDKVRGSEVVYITPKAHSEPLNDVSIGI